MKGVDQRAVPVGVTPVTLCAANPARRGVMVGSPLGTSGAWVTLLWNLSPTATVGVPLFFGAPAMMIHEDDYG